ncbi:MAG: MBL fold metallo-hydrolase [Syntrophomonadaceae bacterium]
MIQLSENVKLLGNGYFNFYLVGRHQAALVECGTRAGAQIFAEQWEQMENKPRVEFIIALHSHFDHVCGIPTLKGLFPEAKVVASASTQKTLAREDIVTEHFRNDARVSYTYLEKGLIDKLPDLGEIDRIDVDRVVGQGDVLEIEPGLTIEILDAPGHSACSIAAYIPHDQVMLVSDAVGFVASTEVMPPIFFQGYDLYVDTIKRLMTYPTKVLGGAHGDVARDDEVGKLYQRSLDSAEKVAGWVVEQLQSGLSEDELTSRLYEQYIKDGLSYYPEEMMVAVMNLIIKRSKTRQK